DGVRAEHEPRLLGGAEDAVHGGGRRAAGEAREDEVRVAAARVDRADERRAEAEPGDPLELAAGVVHALEGKPSRREETLGRRGAVVACPAVVGAREGGGALDALDERE